jgi:hypothetical protein
MRLTASLLGTILLLLGQIAPAAADDPVRHVRVHFERGTSGATLNGHVEGRESIEYKLNARQGQMMRVDLQSRSTAVYFNIFEPGRRPGRDAALFIGETGGNSAEFRTAHAGDYLVQVFLVRAAARRGESAAYSVRFAITGDSPQAQAAHAAPRPSTDARVPGTAFNATGEIPCARERGQPMGSCRFGVRREGNGNGAITVFWPGGGNRVIFFEDNTPMRFDESQADGGARMTVGHEADLYQVRIGNQRFEIPEAVMTGG